MFSCKNKEVKTIESEININEIETNFMKWWTYYNNNISLSSNFTALNEHSETINKKQFLERLITGNYIPLKVESNHTDITYQLYELNSEADENIGVTIKNQSLIKLNHLNMEGLPIPQFEFTDLKGNSYTNINTKGKILVLKTWFINCKACVAEFPELNKLIEDYNKRNDIIFLSLALDNKKDLVNFLENIEFKYQTVPNQSKFIKEKLKLEIYPSHIIVDKKGKIKKVINKASQLSKFLEATLNEIELEMESGLTKKDTQ